MKTVTRKRERMTRCQPDLLGQTLSICCAFFTSHIEEDAKHHQTESRRGSLTVQQEGTRGKLRVEFQFFTLHKTTSGSWLGQSTRQTAARQTHSFRLKRFPPSPLLAVGYPTCTSISTLGSGLPLWVHAMCRSYFD